MRSGSHARFHSSWSGSLLDPCENLTPRIIQRNFDPGFFVDHVVKDMEIALEEAKRMNLDLPGLALVHQLYRAVQDQGHSRLGNHALM